MIKKLSLLCLFFLVVIATKAQISITSLPGSYSQNFNSLSDTGIANAFNLTGWYASVPTYRANYGMMNNGALYSFGDTLPATHTDRALGTVGSSSVKPAYGVRFNNNSSLSMTGMTVAYTAEQWRLGQKPAKRLDSTSFYYNIGVDSLNASGWIKVPDLGILTIDTSATAAGPLDGNLALNRKAISFTISGFVVSPGSNIWIKWVENDVSGSDDGLAVDDLSVTITGSSVAACTEPAASVTNVVFSGTGLTTASGSFTGTAPASDGYLVVVDSVATPPTITDATAYTVGQAIGSGKVVSNGTSTSFTATGLVANTIYYAYVFPYNNASCSGGPNYKTTSPANDSAKTFVDACPEPTAKPTNLTFTTVNNNTISGQFTAASPAPTGGYVVVISTSSNVAYPLDSTAYNVGDSIKYTSFKSKVVYVGTGTTFSATGLVAGTRYYFAVVPFNTCSYGPNYLRTTPLRADTTTTGTAPLQDCVQPTGISNTSIIKVDSTTNTITIKWTNSVNADSVMVAAAPTTTIGFVTIRDSAYYAVGSTLPSNGTTPPIVYYRGTDSTLTLTGLLTNTVYKILIVPFNNRNCTNGPNYAGIASTTIRTAAGTDCSQPSGVSTTSIVKLDSTTTTISIKWTNPANADSVMVFAAPTTTIGFVTLHDSVYYPVGSTVPSSGTTQPIVYYRGKDSSVTLTGLLPNTVYKILIATFNNKNCTNGPNYSGIANTTIKTASGTDCVQPSGVSNTSIIKLDSTATTITIKWTNPSNADSVMVAAAPSATIGFVTIHDSAFYAVNASLPSNGTTPPKVYYRGTDSTITLTGLTPNTVYKILVVSFNNKSCTNGPNYAGVANTTVKTGIATAVRVNNTAQFSMYPNPVVANGNLTVKLEAGISGKDIVFEVTDLMGRKVSSTSVNHATTQLTIPVGDLSKGIYILSLISNNEISSATFRVE